MIKWYKLFTLTMSIVNCKVKHIQLNDFWNLKNGIKIRIIYIARWGIVIIDGNDILKSYPLQICLRLLNKTKNKVLQNINYILEK